MGFVEIYFRQPSIIIIAAARLSGSFLLCLLIDGRGKAGAARVIIPDITSRTIKGAAPRHAERVDGGGGRKKKKKNEPSRPAWCQDVRVIDVTSSPLATHHRFVSEAAIRRRTEGELWSAHHFIKLINNDNWQKIFF